MADCRDVQVLLATGQGLAEAQRSHLRRCAVCRGLAADGGVLARALGTPVPPAAAAAATAPLFAAVSGLVARERGPVAWLRSLPTVARGAITAALTGVLMAVVAAVWPRPDLGADPVRMALAMAFLLAAAAVALGLALRPLHRPPLRPAGRMGIVLAVLAAPALLALLPAAALAGPAMPSAPAGSFAAQAAGCFGFGAAAALPVLAFAAIAERGALRSPRRLTLGAAFAGLTGVVALELSCPMTVVRAHLLVGHATLPVALVGLSTLFLGRLGSS